MYRPLPLCCSARRSCNPSIAKWRSHSCPRSTSANRIRACRLLDKCSLDPALATSLHSYLQSSQGPFEGRLGRKACRLEYNDDEYVDRRAPHVRKDRRVDRCARNMPGMCQPDCGLSRMVSARVPLVFAPNGYIIVLRLLRSPQWRPRSAPRSVACGRPTRRTRRRLR